MGATNGRYTITSNNVSGLSASLFNGLYSDPSATISANTTGSIEIDFNPMLGWTPNTGTGFVYNQGIIALSFWSSSIPQTILIETYQMVGGTDQWTTLFSTTTNTSNPAVFRTTSNWNYVKKIRFSFFHPTASISVTELEWFPARAESTSELSFVPAHGGAVNVGLSSLNFKGANWTSTAASISNSGNAFFGGKVGIGTTTSNGTLHVRPTTDANLIVSNNNSLGSPTVVLSSANDANNANMPLEVIASGFNLKGGNVGIGTTSPNYALDVAGDINLQASSALRFGGMSVCTSTGCSSSSDLRLKEDIGPLQGALEKILQLKGVEYYYRDRSQFGGQKHIGLVAQAVEAVYPEVVKTDQQNGYKAIAYDHLVAPIIEAIKELHKQIVKLKEQLTVRDREITLLLDGKIDRPEVDAKINQLQLENEQLRKENTEIKLRLEKLEKRLSVP